MPELPLTSPQARYLLNMVKIHLGSQAPPEREVSVHCDEVGRLTVQRGDTSWSADGDGVAEVVTLEDGRVRKGRWRFCNYTGPRSPIRSSPGAAEPEDASEVGAGS